MTETPHPDPLVLDRYIAGELVGSAAASVEGHVASCSDCAEALRREAFLACAMREAAEGLAVRPLLVRPARRLAYALAFAAVAAAAAILVLVRPHPLSMAATTSGAASVALVESDVAARASMSAGEAFDGPMTAATDSFDDRMNAPASTL